MRMSTRSDGRTDTRRSGRISFAAAALLAFAWLGIGTLAARGNDGPGRPGTDSGPSSFGGGDDETVGTLPIFGGGSTLDVRRHARITSPSLYIQGSVDDVLSAAVSVRGDRRVLAVPMWNGDLRLVFLGEAQIGFDRNAFHAAQLDVGVIVPESSTVLRSGASWNGQSLGTWSYVYELPIAQFEANGMLDQAPIHAAISTTHGATSVRANANVDLVTLTQLR